MGGSDVVAWLRAEPDANVVDVVTSLLRVCHAELHELRARWGKADYERARSELRDAAAAAVGPGVSLRLDSPVLTRVAELLERGFSPLGVPYACHAVAVGLDIARGTRFGDYFDGDGAGVATRALSVGDPFPRHPAPTLKILADPKDSPGNPDNLSAPLVRTPHLGIVTDDHGVRLQMTSVRTRLGAVHRDTKIALIATNQDRGEFSATLYDEARQLYTSADNWSAPKGYFYGVRPGVFGSEEAALEGAIDVQKQRIAQGIERVARAGTQIVMLPEFSTTDQIHTWLLSEPEVASIPVFVAGSHHKTTESGIGPGTNEAQVLLRGTCVARVAKFTDFNLRLKSPPFPPVYFHEDLRAEEATIHLVVGSNASLIALICKDAMNDDVIQIVRMLAPTLLLIPTMSPELASFQATAHSLGHFPQTITAVANIGQPTGLVGRPTQKEPVISGPCEAAAPWRSPLRMGAGPFCELSQNYLVLRSFMTIVLESRSEVEHGGHGPEVG